MALVWVQGNRYERELAELREQVAGEREAAARAEADQVKKYRELEGNAREAIAAVLKHAKEERDREENAAATARAEYLAGTRRMSIAVRSCQAGAGGGATADSAAAGGVGEARAELAPEPAAVLDAIARDGDRGIRDANTCIDAYNAVRDTLNQAQQE
ncbi:lysozyme [Cupriavidus basilensis]|uniref:Lysozyme n=1 Tax=Cupriavidus basilensis TaxID=68895 RepID=A0ABT6AXJ6_9BURK|nr:lysozyme [Cupriavidus basilensis]MDF3837318.1 lysozyme [Cupriavidus basilensis]